MAGIPILTRIIAEEAPADKHLACSNTGRINIFSPISSVLQDKKKRKEKKKKKKEKERQMTCSVISTEPDH